MRRRERELFSGGQVAELGPTGTLPARRLYLSWDGPHSFHIPPPTTARPAGVFKRCSTRAGRSERSPSRLRHFSHQTPELPPVSPRPL